MPSAHLGFHCGTPFAAIGCWAHGSFPPLRTFPRPRSGEFMITMFQEGCGVAAGIQFGMFERWTKRAPSFRNPYFDEPCPDPRTTMAPIKKRLREHRAMSETRPEQGYKLGLCLPYGRVFFAFARPGEGKGEE